jgi:hypothetical protein
VPSAGVDVVRAGVMRDPVLAPSEATSERLPAKTGRHAPHRAATVWVVRSVLDFYRARPLVGSLVFVVGLAIAVATVSLQKGDGIILPIAFTAAMGIVVGSVVALGQRRRRDGDLDDA